MFLFHDFYSLWAGARLTIEGQNPYDQMLVADLLLKQGVALTEMPGGFHNPPWSLWLFLPFAFLPIGQAQAAWMFCSAISTMLSLYLLFQGVSFRESHIPFKRYLWALIVFFPLTKGVLVGQMISFLLLALIVFTRLSEKRRFVSAGVFLSLALVKPHLFLPFYLGLVIFELKKRRISMIVGVLIGVFLQFVVSYLIGPGNFAYFASSFQQFAVARAGSLQPSIPQIMNYFQLGILSQTVFYLGAVIGAVYLSSESSESSFIWHRLLPFSLLCAAYAWGHDFLILLPSYLALFCFDYRNNPIKAMTVVTVVGLGCWLGLLISPAHMEWLALIYPIYILCRAIPPQFVFDSLPVDRPSS